MKRLILVAAAVMLIASGMAASAVAVSTNVIRNGSFEDIGGAQYGQAILPSEWFQVDYPAPYAGADTYSNDGSFGLWPHENGNFSGVSAQDGIRFVAGADIESFGQTLTNTLIPGQTYVVSAWIHRALRFDLSGVGGYDVYLADTAFGSRVKVATLGPDTCNTQWEYFTASFEAPVNAGGLPVLIFDPYGTEAYPGIDNVSMDAVPEPASIVALASGLIGLIGLRRRKA